MGESTYRYQQNPDLVQMIGMAWYGQQTVIALNSGVQHSAVKVGMSIESSSYLVDQGFVLYTGRYPRRLQYEINLVKPPWGDLRVRKALQYAIDRESLCRDVLNNICTPATGQISNVHKWYGNPGEDKYHRHQ